MLSDENQLKNRGRRPGPLKRISASDATAVREILAVASQVFEPEEQTQRQLFAALMPDLFVLRNKGYSFRQLADLLNRSGFELQPGTVRSYYAEMIEEKMEICQQRFNEQMLLLNEVQKLTRTAEAPKLANRISELRDQQKKRIEDRVNRVLDLPPQAALEERGPVEGNPATRSISATGRPQQGSRKEPGRTVEPPPTENAGDAGEFGLLGKGTATVSITPGGGFVDMGMVDVPHVPEKADHAPQASTPLPPKGRNRAPAKPAPEVERTSPDLRCQPLQPDVPPLQKRAGVPPEVYETGQLEHPAIAGLMLSLDERLYGAALEYVDTATAELLQETLDQKRFRIKWTKPMEPGGSQRGFIPLHTDTLPST